MRWLGMGLLGLVMLGMLLSVALTVYYADPSPGSIIPFRQSTFWDRYGWPIIGMLGFGALQTALIVGLIVNRAKVRRGEAEATMIADISSKFVSLLPMQMDSGIMDAARRICAQLDVDQIALWQWSNDGVGSFKLTHYYSAKDGPLPTGLNDREDFPWIRAEMRAGRILALASLEKLPPEADHDREVARHLGIKSSLCLPLSVGGKPTIGVLALNSTRARRRWPSASVERLAVFSQIFANALARKHVDQTLRDSEELSRVTFEQAAVGIGNVGTDARWLRVNDRLCAILGYPREEILNSNFRDLTHPDDLKIEHRHIERALSGEIASYSMEKRFFQKDGSTVWAFLTVSLVQTSADAASYFIAIVEDITERKRAEAALRGLSGRLIRAHEQERARLARELHDDVTQRLARLAIDASQAECITDKTLLATAMRSIRTGLVCLSEDIHALSYRLHPSILADLGLAEALKSECDRFSRQESIAADVKLRDLPTSIPPETALCVFRVAQEALRNVARHSRASRVEISVRGLDGGIQLAVCDNGEGFEPEEPRKRASLGLASMRERVHLLDGELEIESKPAHGTVILVWVPLNGEHHDYYETNTSAAGR